MDKVFQKLRNLDAYPKINEDFYSRTLSGGVVTLISALITLFLFFSEFRLYLHTVTETKLMVDTSRGERLHINFDVVFPAIPCSMLSLDAMDISGEQHLDIRHDIVKKRIDSHSNVIEVRPDGIGAPKIEKPLQRHGGRLEHNEKYCGTCYGAETSDDDCCNTCEEVREAYRKKGWALTNVDLIDQCKREGFVQRIKDEEGEGCNIYGSLEVNKVAGNFHFALGKSFHHPNFNLHDLLAIPQETFNMSHKINKLAFGDYFPGVVNPLDGVEIVGVTCSVAAGLPECQNERRGKIIVRVQWIHAKDNGIYQYFLKVVPTTYIDFRGRTVQSNQYSVTEHFRNFEMGHAQSPPGVFFFYDFSPIKVTFKEEHIQFLHFVTNICAIIGGIFTIAGIVDSFIYYGEKTIKKKRQLGKFS